MARVYSLEEARAQGILRGAICAFGVFDGVHVGHCYLLDQARQAAEAAGAPFVVLTFDIDPDELFHPERLRKLLGNDDRLALLAECGAAAVAVIPFTREFAALSPAEFLQHTFAGAAPLSLHVGADIRFGAKAAGTVADLRVWGNESGTQIAAHDLLNDHGQPVTATRIRLLLQEGEAIAEANRLLGRAYFVRGIVEPGRGEGADMGFRTANLHVPDQLRALGDGVYAAWATVAGQRYKAAVSVGVAPTFKGVATATCEVHLLDFAGDLYGAPITVEFLHWLRPMMEFPSLDVLIATVTSNIAWVRENL